MKYSIFGLVILPLALSSACSEQQKTESDVGSLVEYVDPLYEDIRNSGTLTFEMGSEHNKEWSVREDARPPISAY